MDIDSQWKYNTDLEAFDDSFNSFIIPYYNEEMKPRKDSNGSINLKCEVTLAWQDLSVYVPVKNTSFFGHSDNSRPYKRLLHNVSGIVYPGNLVAIMGSSGAGKTTLMNILGYRAKSDVAMTGHILVNGIETGPFISKLSGYVYQEDLFVGSLTVSEHLHFMAKMKMDRRLRTYERNRRVEELLIELGLKRCEDRRIGIPGHDIGISGGERKRLAFATEILTDPQILFCDEPTTGLDSFSAQRLVSMMRDMAAKGKTILCTIHQPSSQLFSMFDQLCLLAEGQMAYMGTPQGAIQFFSDLGQVCPDHFNPAEFFIRTTAVSPGDEYDSKWRIRAICNHFALSPMAKEIEKNLAIEFKKSEADGLIISSTQDYESFFGLNHQRLPFWFYKTFLLLKRALVDSYRNPGVHILRTIQKTLLGILVGICFVGLTLDQEGIQGVEGALYVFINENTFPSIYTVIAILPLEFPLFLREHKAGLYAVNSYYLARSVSLIPGFIIEPAIFTTLAYFIIGLRPTLQAYLITVAASVLNANTASALGFLTSAYCENVSTANSLLAPISFVFMVLGGFYINLASMTPWVSWMQYLSIFRYANEALNIAQWEGVTNITCSSPTEPCIRTGNEVLESRNFDGNDATFNLFGLFVLYLVFHVAAYITLLRKCRQH